MSTRAKRIFQVFLAAVFGLIGLMFLFNGARSGNSGLMVGALIPLAMAGIFYGIFEIQLRSFKKAGDVVKSNIEACSTSLFDAPASISEGYDLDATVANQFLAGFAREANNDAAFTTEGRCGDVKVSVGSHVSVMGRQIGEFHHTYSHVLVDLLGLNKPFRVTRERATSKLGKALGTTRDVKLGDKGFDDTFVIDTDDELARSVFDESIRQRLLALQAQVSNVSTDMGAGGMGIVLTKRGLALRWPGDMPPDLAKLIRDLLIDMRTRILAHENRVAVRVGTEATSAGGGYRVSTEEAEAPADAEAQARNAAG